MAIAIELGDSLPRAYGLHTDWIPDMGMRRFFANSAAWNYFVKNASMKKLDKLATKKPDAPEVAKMRAYRARIVMLGTPLSLPMARYEWANAGQQGEVAGLGDVEQKYPFGMTQNQFFAGGLACLFLFIVVGRGR